MNEADDKILNQIILFIKEKMGNYDRALTSKTCLEKDLGIIGDDAVELLLEYGKKFDVDLSNLDMRRYFTPEGDTILPSIIRVFTLSKEPKVSELTIGDLVKGVQAKQLNQKMIENQY
jgi:acyl carrier protein